MKKFALIGNKISYSLSPKIHRAIFEFYQLDGYSYELVDIGEEELVRGFAGLMNDYAGFNVTIPYKNLLAGLVDVSHSPIGALNTIIKKNGEIVGYNTDIDGLRVCLSKIIHCLGYYVSNGKKAKCPKNYANSDELGHLSPKNAVETLIIGAGGAAESAAYSLKNMGIDAQVMSRKGERLDSLVARYRLDIYEPPSQPRLIINASGKDCASDDILSTVNLTGLEIYFDLSYNTTGARRFIEDGGARYVDGLDMLIYQAIYAAELLYGIKTTIKIDELYNYILSRL